MEEQHVCAWQHSKLQNPLYAGASVIYADTVADLGYANELGNYAEYSGAPNQQVMRQHNVLPSCLHACTCRSFNTWSQI